MSPWPFFFGRFRYHLVYAVFQVSTLRGISIIKV